MKKITTVLFVLSVISFANFAQERFAAKVEEVSGKVEIYKGNSWQSLAQGTELFKGDIISTGFNSEAVISVNESKIKLSALTRLTVEQLTQNDKKEQTQLFIDSGKISANVKHTENKRTDFKVRSPVSTASVRGTDFTFLASGKISTSEGLVSTSPSTSLTAEVAESDGASDFTPENADSSVFTETAEVGDSYGTPVYEGQETTADFMTGQIIPTQLSMITSTRSVGGFTPATGNSLLEDGTATLSSLTSGSISDSPSSNNQTEPTSGSISITLTF